MGRAKKKYEDEDYDLDTYILIESAVENIILNPIKGFGISHFNDSYITFHKKGKSYHFKGYSGDFVDALQLMYRCMIDAQVLKSAKSKEDGLAISEAIQLFHDVNKEFDALMKKVEVLKKKTKR